MFDFSASVESQLEKLGLKPARVIDQDDDAWIAAGYLVTSLNSFSDGLVVMDGKTPAGTFGGKSFLAKLIQNPTFSFFKGQKVKAIMQSGLVTFRPSTSLDEIITYWQKSRFAFALIDFGGSLMALSVRNFLSLIAELDLPQKISEIPAKEIISFTSDETIHDVFNKMLKNNVRRLRFEDTPRLISDRTLLDDICIQMNYLKFTENLLETKANTLTTEKPDEITDDLTISQMAKKLATMIHPFVLYKEQIITPWDLLMMFYNGEKQ